MKTISVESLVEEIVREYKTYLDSLLQEAEHKDIISRNQREQIMKLTVREYRHHHNTPMGGRLQCKG